MPYDQTVGMDDFGFLPPNYRADVQSFFCNSAGQGSFQWIKPNGVTMVYMVTIGGGGGGGGGRTGATTTARGGGGGGACSGIAKMITPAIFLPDHLVIQVGAGGAGGAANVNGSAGTDSIIAYGVGITGISTIPNIILQANGSTKPGGGQAGQTSGNATGGTVPTISTVGIQGAAASYGVQTFLVGIVGSTGGIATGANGTLASSWVTIALSPGAGGAGVNSVSTAFTGGQVFTTGNAAFDFADGLVFGNPSVAGGVSGSGPGTGPGGNGNQGIQLWKPFYMTGGSGGGSSDNNIGGNGGSGGIGCGGGGGGGGTTGGTGGNGGDGCVIIISW